jgi:hypothetical protein
MDERSLTLAPMTTRLAFDGSTVTIQELIGDGA